jgi:hypothetical protein
MADIDLGPLTPRAPDPLDNIVVVKESDPEEMGLLPVASFATAAQGALADTAVQPAAIAKMVISDTTGITGADAITNIVSLTQAEYDAITTPDASTLYVIAG